MNPSTTFNRILTNTAYLSVNSILNNVTIPNFVVDNFEWIKDPDSVLTSQQLPLFRDFDKPSPYFTYDAKGGLLPDSKWGLPKIGQLGAPVVVSESRLFTFRVGQQLSACSQNYSIDPGSEVKLHQALVGVYSNCYAIANVTYRAGAAICENCRLISPTIVQSQAPLPVIADSFTPMALIGTYTDHRDLSYLVKPRPVPEPHDKPIVSHRDNFKGISGCMAGLFGHIRRSGFRRTPQPCKFPCQRCAPM
jgi:hypothetical protein